MNAIPDLVPLHDSRPGLRSLLQVQVRDAAAPAAALDFVASTATLDRYHEVIEPAGWQLDAYRRNPVFQNAHNYGDILFTLGKALLTEVRTIDGGQALCQRIQFAIDVNPVARIAYGLYKGGFLNAVSVGFIPLRWEDAPPAASEGRSGTQIERVPAGHPDGRDAVPSVPIFSPLCAEAASSGSPSSKARRRYLEQELLEVSAVAIPANPDALALGLKSGAVGKADLKATLELFQTLAGQEPGNPWIHFARELQRVMRKA
jgi:hypothetical protein